MTNRERRDAQMAYIADAEVYEDIKRARRLTHKLNTMDPHYKKYIWLQNLTREEA